MMRHLGRTFAVSALPVLGLLALAGLIQTLPNLRHRQPRLPVIPGGMPNLAVAVPGCRFADRCPKVVAQCREQVPPLVTIAPGHDVACFRAEA